MPVTISVNEFIKKRKDKDPQKRFSSEKEWDSFFVFVDKIRARMSREEQEELVRILPEEIEAVRKQHQGI